MRFYEKYIIKSYINQEYLWWFILRNNLKDAEFIDLFNQIRYIDNEDKENISKIRNIDREIEKKKDIIY